MGAVAIDIHKKEREFQHLTLSDSEVVKYLILYRNKVDVAYGANTNIDINCAGDMFEFNQELICLYASLDDTIERIELNEKEQKFLRLIFEGNTVADVISVHKLYAKKTAYRTLNRIVDSVVVQNLKQWKVTLNNTIFEDR